MCISKIKDVSCVSCKTKVALFFWPLFKEFDTVERQKSFQYGSPLVERWS